MGALAVETTGVRPEARMEVDSEVVEEIEMEEGVEVEGDMQMEVPLPLPVILLSFAPYVVSSSLSQRSNERARP